MSTPDWRCEAIVYWHDPAGHRCTKPAATRHYVHGHSGRSILLCPRHDEMLDKRTRRGSTPEVLASWGYEQPPHEAGWLDGPVHLEPTGTLAPSPPLPEAL